MATITPNKTDNFAVVLAHAAVTHPTTVVGAKIDVSTKRAVNIFMYHAYVEATLDTNPGKFKVQIRPDAGSGSENEHWFTVAEYLVKGTSPDTEALTGTPGIGVKVLTVVSTTGFLAEDLLYIQDAGALTDSEWAECQEVVSNTSIDLIDGLKVAKDSSDVIWNDASKFVCSLDLNAVEAFRVIWSHEGATGANGHIKAECITYDSDNSA